jgi:hypothetical protein
VDFKTKDGDFSDGKKLAWDQNIQLAAYHVGLGLSRLKDPTTYSEPLYLFEVPCANIFVSRTHPGAVASHVWTPDEVAEGWKTFEAALRLWKIVKNYDGKY